MAGHTAGNGMDGVVNSGALGFESVGELLDLVLGLSKSHAVAGHDHDALGSGEHGGSLFVSTGHRGGSSRSGLGGGRIGGQVDELADGFHSVAEHHEDALLGVEGVRHAGVAGLVVEVADDDVLSLVDLEDGHAVDGRAFGGVSGGVDDVVSTDDDHEIGVGEHGIDGIHFQHVFVVHVGFSEEHVHVAGHTAGNGMDGVVNGSALGFESVGELLDLVLGLGKSHAVAGHDHDALGSGEHVSGFFFHAAGSLGSRSGGGLGSGGRSSGGLGGGSAGTGAEEDGGQSAVHGLAHDHGQHVAGRADDAANGNEQGVSHGETGDGAGDAAHGVQQRDGDGHVSAANTDAEHDTESGTGEGHHGDPEAGSGGGGSVEDDHGHDHHAEKGVDDVVVVRQDDGLLGQHAMELASGHEGAGDGGHTGAEGEAGVNAMEEAEVLALRTDVGQHDEADEGSAAAAEAMQESHQLRHLDHLDLVGKEETESHTGGDGDPQGDVTHGVVAEHGDDDGKSHGAGGDGVAADSQLDVAHQVEAVEDGQSQHHSDDGISEHAHGLRQLRSSGYPRFLPLPAIIFSILLVMSKPPKTLVVARATATPPRKPNRGVVAKWQAVRAPSTITPSRAFMLDIRGVCRRLGMWLRTL